jgi:hypothetical protein
VIPRARRRRAALLLASLCACPSPRHPTQPAGEVTIPIGRDGASLRGVASDGRRVFAALGDAEQTVVEAREGAQVAWTVPLTGAGGPLAATRALVFATVGGKSAAGEELRGEPGAVVVALDAASGAVKWKRAIDASEWAVIAAVAPIGDGVLVAGSFGGTLRAGSHSVSSGGAADGFVARLADSGDVAWLVRMGGVGVDGVQGVAAAGDRIAIAGIFAAGADLLGEPLAAYAPRTPRADGFVAELDSNGARRWVQTFGHKLDDSVAGVAIDGTGRVAVAASVREVMRMGSTELVARGDADGAIGWWTKDGVPGAAVQLGGAEFDAVRGLVAVGDGVVVAGVFSGTLRIDQRTFTAGGGDDAYLAAFENGVATRVWPVTGDGREEVAALAPVPGGFVAGITHTARAEVGGASLPAPKDPLSGAALVIRPVR